MANNGEIEVLGCLGVGRVMMNEDKTRLLPMQVRINAAACPSLNRSLTSIIFEYFGDVRLGMRDVIHKSTYTSSKMERTSGGKYLVHTALLKGLWTEVATVSLKKQVNRLMHTEVRLETGAKERMIGILNLP